MFSRIFQLSSLGLFAVAVGCGPADPVTSEPNNSAHVAPDEHADPHDIPLTAAEIDSLREQTATWPTAMEHIKKYRDTIQTETTGGAPAKAHRSLDLLDHVLEWLPEIAQSSNVPKDDWQTVGENAQKLRDAFNRVHANIDDGKAPDYESVAAEIEAAVNTLNAIEPGAAPESN